MHVITATDVNEALPRALSYLRQSGTPESTRNGPAIVAPGPVATVYRYPRRRVLFDAARDANPFFHLFESLWILAGRNDVKTLKLFNSRISQYSDNGETYHAAYGHRLRSQFGFDQILRACRMLKESPESRRAVLQIWSAGLDLGTDSKDLPCNDLVMLRVRDAETFHPAGRVLDITVCNRSNDAIWGAYGANAVQFSMLQEYMAGKIGVGVGQYTQMSHNLHAYTDNPYWKHYQEKTGGGIVVPQCEYDTLSREGYLSFTAVESPLLSPGETPEQFDRDLGWFFVHLDGAGLDLNRINSSYVGANAETRFFRHVVLPMLRLYVTREYPDDVREDSDWLVAGRQWVERRKVSKTSSQGKEQ